MPANTAIGNKRLINAALFGGVAIAWFAIDYATKRWADTFGVSDLLWSGIPGVLDFRLVHNTGAAWGMFGDSTFGLGIFAVAFCVLLLAVAIVRSGKAPMTEMIGYGLVLAGGIGNAIDRFMSGYVTDFIEATFIDFPVFNVADIGVTCGFALLVICYIIEDKKTQNGEES